MTSARKLRAQAVLRLSIKVAPQEHANWFEAMASEMDHVPDTKLLRFALGGLTAAVRMRIVQPAFILATANGLLVGGAMLWAALNIWFAGRMSLANAPSLEVFAYCVAAIFVAGAIATGRVGLGATIGLGAPFMVLLIVAGFAVKLLLPQSPTTDLYFALIAEDLAVLLLALLIAFGAPRLVAGKHGAGR